jgi:hypothetical protein
MPANDVQHLLLALGELVHHGHLLCIYTGAVIIYSIFSGGQGVRRLLVFQARALARRQ